MVYSVAPWWDSNYTYRRCISITAPGGEAVPVSYSAELTVDTAALESASKVRSDRKDWRIVYWDGSTNTELDRHYSATNSTWFKVQSEIAASATSTSYFCYYGYASESSAAAADWDNAYWWGDNFEDGEISDWDTDTGAGGSVAASSSSPLTGSYSLLMVGAPTTYCYAWDSFTDTPASQSVVVQFQYKKEAGTFCPRIWVKNGATELFNWWVSTNAQYYYTSALSHSRLANGTTVTMRFEIDIANAQVDVYENDVSKLSNKACAGETSIDTLRVSAFYAQNVRYDNVIVRLLMATAPTITATDEAQHVADTLVAQFDVGNTTVVTDTLVVQYDVWQGPITDTLVAQYDKRNVVTDTLVAQFDVIEFVWDGGAHAVRLPYSEHRLDLPDSEHAVRLPYSQHNVTLIETGE